MDARFARGNRLRDLRLKGRGRLSWRPLSLRPFGGVVGGPIAKKQAPARIRQPNVISSAAIRAILPWSLPRARSMPLRAAPRTHRKRRLAPRPCGGNSRLACCTSPRACLVVPFRSLLARSQRKQTPASFGGGLGHSRGLWSSPKSAVERRRARQRSRPQFVPGAGRGGGRDHGGAGRDGDRDHAHRRRFQADGKYRPWSALM